MAGGEFRFGTASIYMRRTSADRAARYNSQPRYYMATDLDRVRQFFPDFRRFIVMASRKLGLAIKKLRVEVRNSDGESAIIRNRFGYPVIRTERSPTTLRLIVDLKVEPGLDEHLLALLPGLIEEFSSN